MHQTAFGKARPDIPYTDLTAREISALTLLIAAASYQWTVLLESIACD